MGIGGISHWLILGVVLVLVLGGGRFSNMMGDVAKGIKQFKKGMSEEDEPVREPSRIDTKKAAEPVVEVQADKLREDR
jgi:sec-independent protein translocase protein TatA